MEQRTRERVIEHLSNAMERIVERRCVTEPFDENEISQRNPFGARLVPMEIWKGAKFERSFVTTLGQSIFEQLAKIIAEGTGAEVATHFSSRLTVNTFRMERIDSILAGHRDNNRHAPNWEREVSDLLTLHNERFEDTVVISDLYIRRQDGRKEYYSIKTVKPNLDQTERAKRDMLRLLATDETNQVFFALPYNPAGEGEIYSGAGHTIPYKIFNMDEDECVLIGAEFWNKVGDSEDTYDELLNLFEEVGGRYSPIIIRRYLGF